MGDRAHVAIEELDALTPAELILLEGHLKLGADHLKKHLNAKEIESLLQLGETKKEPFEKIRHNRTEITGHLTLLLNTIFTATFGAWLGLSGFWGFSLGCTPVVASVVIVAALIGAFIGYHNFRHAKLQARAAIRSQQVSCLQIEILDKIYEKRSKEINDIIDELNRSLSILTKGTSFENAKIVVLSDNDFKSKEQILEWISRLDGVLQEKFATDQKHKVYEIFSDELGDIQSKLGKNLKDCCQGYEEVEVIHADPSKQKNKQKSPLLEKLTTCLPKEPHTPVHWIRSQWRALMISFVPTVLGGFSSLFVYLSGGPHVLEALGDMKLFNTLSNPKAKVIEFSISIAMTCFLAFSFIHVNRKLIKRRQELEKTENIIIEKEGELTILDARLLKLKEAKNRMAQILNIFSTLERILSLHFQ